MKKRILSILLLLPILFLASCRFYDYSSTKKPAETTAPLPEPTRFPVAETPLDELTPYNYDDFLSHTSRRNIPMGQSVRYIKTLTKAREIFPIQRIVPIGNENLCVIYLFKTSAEESVYIYMIFDKLPNAKNTHRYTGWVYDSEFYFVTKILSYSDFASISVGSPAADVSAVDSSLAFDQNNGYFSTETTMGFTMYKLLTDGLLIMTLEAPRPSDGSLPLLESYSVSGMTFYPHDSSEIPHNVSVLGYPDLLQEN